jgi:hypothetical protein
MIEEKHFFYYLIGEKDSDRKKGNPVNIMKFLEIVWYSELQKHYKSFMHMNIWFKSFRF